MALSFPLWSHWVKMAPVANAEASTCRDKGLLGLGCFRDGLERTMSMSVSNASWNWGVQTKGWSFRVKSVSGFAMEV